MASRNKEEHRQNLREVLNHLRDNGMAINASKCVMGQSSVKYLGQEISAAGVRPLPSKLQSIIDVPRPTTEVELQRYLGMVNFYHRFLPGIAASLSPLHSLVAAAKAAKTKLVWDEAAVSSYERSKEKLFSPVLLAHPRPKAKLTLTTDASDIAIGACLLYTSPSPRDLSTSRMPSSA